MLKNLSLTQIKDINEILKDMKYLPHRQFKKNHFGMIDVIKKAEQELKNSDGISVDIHDKLLDTFTMNFVATPKIFRRLSTPSYDSEMRFFEMLDHYQRNDKMNYVLWRDVTTAFFYWNDKYI